MMASPHRVVARFVSASSIPLGKTVEFGSVRVHRYADHFQVTDLTNAGKRGKKVRVVNLSPSYSYPGKPEAWMESMSRALPDYRSYDAILSFIKDVLHDHPGEITISEREVRGVDVNPGGTEKIEMENPNGLSITALPDDFTVKHRYELRERDPDGPANDTGREMYQDTLYWPAKKKDAAVFYNWLKANRTEAMRLDIEGFRSLWRSLGIDYDSH